MILRQFISFGIAGILFIVCIIAITFVGYMVPENARINGEEINVEHSSLITIKEKYNEYRWRSGEYYYIVDPSNTIFLIDTEHELEDYINTERGKTYNISWERYFGYRINKITSTDIVGNYSVNVSITNIKKDLTLSPFGIVTSSIGLILLIFTAIILLKPDTVDRFINKKD
jgi:hypothetical protein